MRKATKELFKQLKRLASEGNANIFQRIATAAKLFEDESWVVEVHDGNIDKAIEAVESEFFSMLGGNPPLTKLMRVYRYWSDESKWAEYAYNLQAMCDVYDAETEEEKPARTKRQTWGKKDVEERDEKINTLEYKLKREEERREGAEDEVSELRRQLRETRDELERVNGENATLKARVEELERLLEKFAPSQTA